MQNEGYKIKDQTKPHFITLTVVDWIDVFTRKCYKDSIVNSLHYCIDYKGMVLYGYVIMSNHLHLIVQSDAGDLSGLIRDFKKFTSKKIVAQIREVPESRKTWMLALFAKAKETHSRNKDFQFWKYGNHPKEIYSLRFLWSKLDYIHLNPVRAGLVEKASHYLYSSARNYVQPEDALIPITLADNPVIDVYKKDSFWKGLQW